MSVQPLRFSCSHLSNSSLCLSLSLPLFLTNTHTHWNSCLSQWAQVSGCQHLSDQGPDIRVHWEMYSGLSAQWDQCVLISAPHYPNYTSTTLNLAGIIFQIIFIIVLSFIYSRCGFVKLKIVFSLLKPSFRYTQRLFTQQVSMVSSSFLLISNFLCGHSYYLKKAIWTLIGLSSCCWSFLRHSEFFITFNVMREFFTMVKDIKILLESWGVSFIKDSEKIPGLIFKTI